MENLYHPQPFIIVIFGATGDLALNKLMPSLFELYTHDYFPKDFLIIGFSRRAMKDEHYRMFFPKLSKDKKWREFASHIYYQEGDFGNEEGYLELIDRLNSFDTAMGACITRFFYLATPPGNYETILDFLYATKLSEGCGQGSSKWTRIVIEKPFGKDLKTAIRLDRKLSRIFEEKQIFRVDHYLGKETVQNILAFRFANTIFEQAWNKNYIDSVQITFAEKNGIGGRGRFFDGVGILRDIGQNHLMQLLAAISMERPKKFEKEPIRDERVKVIKSIRKISLASIGRYVVRGQYKTYLEEKDVLSSSFTETFVAMKLFIDNKRFDGVPFYLRLGKKMPKDTVHICVVFKKGSHELFREYGSQDRPNVLIIKIQPDEGITLKLFAKKPGAKLALDEVNMHFVYKEEFVEKVTDAYDKVLLDIFAGDQTLFNRSDELESSWAFITHILNGFEKGNVKLIKYGDETWGPKEAIDLIEKDGRKWII